MRVGLSFELDGDDGGDAAALWPRVIDEIAGADRLGYDSVWVHEARDRPAACPAPALFLSYVARRTRGLLLRVAGRQSRRDSPVRVAEEIAVLDLWSRGRAGICFASASSQGRPAGEVHELIDFVTSAWAHDAFRYRGDHVRFPTHTPDDAPAGAGTPDESEPYVPQWDRGPVMPDYSAVTPKPVQVHPPVAVALDDDETLEWAAARGVSGFVGASVPTDEAVRRLARYRDAVKAAGLPWSAVEATLERTLVPDGDGDGIALGGTPRELLDQLRAVRAGTGISHLVWRRPADQIGRGDLLYRLAGETQLLLQA